MSQRDSVDAIVEHVANWVGIYGSHVDGELKPCRICFAIALKRRIEEATAVRAIDTRVIQLIKSKAGRLQKTNRHDATDALHELLGEMVAEIGLE